MLRYGLCRCGQLKDCVLRASQAVWHCPRCRRLVSLAFSKLPSHIQLSSARHDSTRRARGGPDCSRSVDEAACQSRDIRTSVPCIKSRSIWLRSHSSCLRLSDRSESSVYTSPRRMTAPVGWSTDSVNSDHSWMLSASSRILALPSQYPAHRHPDFWESRGRVGGWRGGG